MDEFVSTAMVVTFGDGEILFVDQENESPYYPTLPEDAPELTAGNIVRVTGNIWQPKDPSEPPYASVEYATELATVSLMPASNGYTWSFEENGEGQTIVADVPHPTQLAVDDLPDARMDGPTEVTASFDVEATGLTVTRWSEDALDAEGEQVAVEGLSFTVEPGYRYALNATFEQGEAAFVFTVR